MFGRCGGGKDAWINLIFPQVVLSLRKPRLNSLSTIHLRGPVGKDHCSLENKSKPTLRTVAKSGFRTVLRQFVGACELRSQAKYLLRWKAAASLTGLEGIIIFERLCLLGHRLHQGAAPSQAQAKQGSNRSDARSSPCRVKRTMPSPVELFYAMERPCIFRTAFIGTWRSQYTPRDCTIWGFLKIGTHIYCTMY